MVSFGDNIYLWRVFRRLSQKELAEMTGIPRPNISAIESGKRDLSMATLRLLASSLGTTPGALVDGVPPIHFKRGVLSRKSLEAIAQAGLGGDMPRIASQQKNIGILLSGIIRNRINADNKIYKDILKNRQAYINNWLTLKSALGLEVLNNLLARIDKYGSKAD